MVSITGQNNCGLAQEESAIVVSWCEIAYFFIMILNILCNSDNCLKIIFLLSLFFF